MNPLPPKSSSPKNNQSIFGSVLGGLGTGVAGVLRGTGQIVGGTLQGVGDIVDTLAGNPKQSSRAPPPVSNPAYGRPAPDYNSYAPTQGMHYYPAQSSGYGGPATAHGGPIPAYSFEYPLAQGGTARAQGGPSVGYGVPPPPYDRHYPADPKFTGHKEPPMTGQGSKVISQPPSYGYPPCNHWRSTDGCSVCQTWIWT